MPPLERQDVPMQKQ